MTITKKNATGNIIGYAVSTQFKINLLSILFTVAVVFGIFAVAPLDAHAGETSRVTYKTVKIDGLDIFYREAGSPSNPTVLLLHGFPTSSRMYRNLMPLLADRYHVIAPDYPGFGNSSAPPVDKFEYTFANLTDVIDKFTQAVKIDCYSIYLQDYGGPVGFRLAVKLRRSSFSAHKTLSSPCVIFQLQLFFKLQRAFVA